MPLLVRRRWGVESPVPIRSGPVSQPIRCRPEKSPFSFCQNPARSGIDKVVVSALDALQGGVDRVAYAIRVMQSKIIFKSEAVELAPTHTGSVRELFRFVKYGVWKRDGCFHTRSITRLYQY